MNFYDETASSLKAFEFRFLADEEDVTLKGVFFDLRTFLRILISENGIITAAIYHPKPKFLARILLFLFGAKINKTIDLETEFSDGSFITTSTSQDAAKLTYSPLIKTEFLNPQTPIRDLLNIHLNKIQAVLENNSNVTPVKLSNIDEVHESQHRQQAIKADYRKKIGYMTEEEMINIGANKESASKIAQELREMQ